MTLMLIIKVPTPVDQHRRNHAHVLIIADSSCSCASGRRCRYRQVRRYGCGGRSCKGARSAGPAGCAAPDQCDPGAGSGAVALCEAGAGEIVDPGWSDCQSQLVEGSQDPEVHCFSGPEFVVAAADVLD